MTERERTWVGVVIGIAALAAYFPSHNDLFILGGVLLVVVSLLAGTGLVRLKAGLSGFEAEFADQLEKKAKDLGPAPEAAALSATTASGFGRAFDASVEVSAPDASIGPDARAGSRTEDLSGASQIVGQALSEIASAVRDGRPEQAAEEVAESVRRTLYAGQVFAASDMLVDYAIATDPPEALREWERDMQRQTLAGLSPAELAAVRQWRAEHDDELARFRGARDGIARGTGWSVQFAEEAARLGWWLATDVQLRLGRVRQTKATSE